VRGEREKKSVCSCIVHVWMFVFVHVCDMCGCRVCVVKSPLVLFDVKVGLCCRVVERAHAICLVSVSISFFSLFFVFCCCFFVYFLFFLRS
jgi:hypothetical protein